MAKATIVLEDGPENTVNLSVTFDPEATDETRSFAQRTAYEMVEIWLARHEEQEREEEDAENGGN